MELKKKFVLGIYRMKITVDQDEENKSYLLFFFYRKYGPHYIIHRITYSSMLLFLLLIPELRIMYFSILRKFLYSELL